MFRSNRRDTTPRQVWVHSCQLSMSSCSKLPDGLKPWMTDSRTLSLTSGGASLSTYPQAHISMLSGPRGCHTRMVREVLRMNEKLGNTVPANGFTIP